MLTYLRAFDDEDEHVMEVMSGPGYGPMEKTLVQWVSALQREDGGAVGQAFVQSLQDWASVSGPARDDEAAQEERDWVTRSVIRYLHATREGHLGLILDVLQKELEAPEKPKPGRPRSGSGRR
ncbi:hypothetical protein AB0H73_18665 [Streptomyces olivoreticuli]